MISCTDGRLYQRLDDATCRRSITDKVDREVGAVMIDEVAERLSTVFYGSSPELLIRLMATEGDAQLEDLMQRWEQPMNKTKIEAIHVLARWGFGAALGYLNLLQKNNDGLSAYHLLQLPLCLTGTVRTPSLQQPLRTLLSYMR